MTLTLILLRHGEAEDRGPTGKDHSRRLTKRGEREARSSGKQLAEAGYEPDRVLVSDAARTRGTWEAVAKEWTVAAPVGERPALYLPELAQAIEALSDLEGGRCQLAVGHNPAWSDLASDLTAKPVSLRTGAAAVLQIESDDWAAALAGGDGPWSLATVIEP